MNVKDAYTVGDPLQHPNTHRGVATLAEAREIARTLSTPPECPSWSRAVLSASAEIYVRGGRSIERWQNGKPLSSK